MGKPSESLATLQPMGHWARGDRELTTTVDKLRVVRGPVPEDRLAPRVQVNLDELEEDLDDYGENIRTEAEGAGGPPTPEEFRGDAAGVGGPIGVPGEGGEGREAPEAEPPEREDGAADRGMGAATGGTDPLEGGVAGGSGRGRQLDHAEKENPSQGPVGWDQRRGSPLRGRRPAVPPQIARGMFAWSQSRGGP